ncbi:hypothetical protein [Gordonia crocea]|nr:hypothetical protein [Gordonia crocea]
MTTMQHATKLPSEGSPTYNVSSSCLWTLATIAPLVVLLLLLAF